MQQKFLPLHPTDSSELSPQSSFPSHILDGLWHRLFAHWKWLEGQTDGNFSGNQIVNQKPLI